jgi:hypothetical protein
MSHLSKEDIEAVEGRYLEHKEYFLDAVKVVDKLLPDCLVNARSQAGTLNQIDITMYPDDLRSLAKAIAELADLSDSLEKHRREMKAAGLTEKL